LDDVGSVVAFWLLAALTVVSALTVAVVRDLVKAVMALVLSFLGVAGLFVLLSADFLAVVQVLIYAGAISVLIVFAIALTPRAARDNAETAMRWPALALALAVAGLVAAVALVTDWGPALGQGFQETASAIGEALLSRYLLPFEIAAALLLMAVLGAIVLVREE
jgi:NADH-quinone oxidoreductase subunit J